MVRLAKVSRRVPVSQASSASVRADVLQNYSELVGTKTIDGRKVNVEECVQRAGDGPAKETARRALRAHDYVYDVFESVEGVAA
jgi:hypothetical protein